MNENTKRLLIVIAGICFLLVAVVYRNHGRFQTSQQNPGLALDTHTGQMCFTNSGSGSTATIPQCSALAKNFK